MTQALANLATLVADGHTVDIKISEGAVTLVVHNADTNYQHCYAEADLATALSKAMDDAEHPERFMPPQREDRGMPELHYGGLND